VSDTVIAGTVVDISGHVELGMLTVLGGFAYCC
jgi:acyl-[acyl carrier protein]--UDP-N-acetylglucosamine O-acyltransferase